MAGWKSTDAQANNEPSYIAHIGREQQATTDYSNNTILVTASRVANANSTFGVSTKQVAHTGWVNVNKQLGFIDRIAVANVNPALVYTNTFLTFTTSTGTVANASLVVVGGNNVSVVLNSKGAGIRDIPTVSAAGANNTTLTFTVTPGGRLGRVQSEVLVALSSPSSVNANGALPPFTGV